MIRVCLLGATGSIGLQTIEYCFEKKDLFSIEGISFRSRKEVIEKYLIYLPNLKYVAIEDEKVALEFKKEHGEYEVISGDNCSLELVKKNAFDKVVNALVGEAGFLSSVETLKLDMDLCLANKESLVIGGEIIKDVLKKSKGKLFPIDSEHVALHKLFKHSSLEEVERVIITASGGSLRELPKDKLKYVTKEEVLNHPTWKMGNRITIDSATMVNKGFEFIEACHLFNIDIDDIEVLINDESIIHSALLYKDNSYLFEVGPSDMKVAIGYALNEGRRVKADFKDIMFNRKTSLNFRYFDEERYPLFTKVIETYKKKGTAMAFFNAVDEELISYFLKDVISFEEMVNLIIKIVDEKMINIINPSVNDIVKVDKLAREIVNSYMNERTNA
ncbi:MAG: 1-deoxy-D-xylulose-5-phosphate reductoisomerase [Bacilli bacterium]|nr:1-deoxy-D-xylulose-5-phosphate reductoisomerase [Bacilli bacterium]